MTKEQNEESCRRIQNWGEQHPLFHAPFMVKYRKEGRAKAARRSK